MPAPADEVGTLSVHTPADHTLADQTLADQLRGISSDIIDRELQRLVRKAPSLTEADLRAVARTLHDLVEHMVVTRAISLPDREAQLRRLFGLPPASLRGST